MTVQCFLKLPAVVGLFVAFAFQLTTAGPLQVREVMFDFLVDLIVQVVHHHPTSMAWSECPLEGSAGEKWGW